ncbi:Retrotransposon Polyprotein [Phytophthora megakarya]|uniref:Retrotransposon Polyprotein n=1 Tax=Phytophthora megakarya TaxID=4795 RepID=A0A225VGN6_9STRA|nr:Retrotransposon Polyprotein [Phytophthora megakarya]
MPFGLMNAPSTFQRMMNSILRGLTWTTWFVYLDDILVYVLERLSGAGLALKLKECVFATETMGYLGHELSQEGVQPLDRLVNALREFTKPTDATEVKQFVHLVFGSMMEPLAKLLMMNVHWEWGQRKTLHSTR